jgi:hypothetical protein
VGVILKHDDRCRVALLSCAGFGDLNIQDEGGVKNGTVFVLPIILFLN